MTEQFWVLSGCYLEKPHPRTEFGRQTQEKPEEAKAKHIAPADVLESDCSDGHSCCIVLLLNLVSQRPILSALTKLGAGALRQ
jgi:hypothetical protein